MRCSTIIEKYLGAWPWGTIVSTTLSICHCTTLIAKSGYGDCWIFLDRLEYSDLHCRHCNFSSLEEVLGGLNSPLNSTTTASAPKTSTHQILVNYTLIMSIPSFSSIIMGSPRLVKKSRVNITWLFSHQSQCILIKCQKNCCAVGIEI